MSVSASLVLRNVRAGSGDGGVLGRRSIPWVDVVVRSQEVIDEVLWASCLGWGIVGGGDGTLGTTIPRVPRSCVGRKLWFNEGGSDMVRSRLVCFSMLSDCREGLDLRFNILKTKKKKRKKKVIIS